MSLKPGSFCWFELMTLDQEAAKRFYGSIFGWSADDSPMGPDEKYTIFKVGGRDAAAGYTMRAEQRAQGIPPSWMVYVMVESADQAAARAKELGGTVHAGPFDVMDAGRMAVIQDPVGATFCAWESKKHSGVAATGKGSAVWVDLSTPNQEASAKFYGGLFGWKMTEGKSMKPAKPGDYIHIVNGKDFIGGIQPPAHRDPKSPPHWLTYFDVADADATVANVSSKAGRVLMPMMTMAGVRKYAVLADPQGAVFAIVQELGGEKAATPKAAPKKKATKPAAKSKPAKRAAPKRKAAKKPAAKKTRKSKPAKKGKRKR